MSSIKMRVLVAFITVLVFVAMFELAAAQYGGGGYGGYGGRGNMWGSYGGRGYGGRGYGGRGMYGYGRGGYGRGGYGGGYRDYDTYGISTDGGYYDDTSTDTDDLSSYMDVYASSSIPVVGSQETTSISSSTPSSSSSTELDFSGYQDQLGVGANQRGREATTSGSSWTAGDQVSGGSRGQWPLSQLGDSFYNLKSFLGSRSSQSNQNSKARERSVLAPELSRQSTTNSNGALATKPGAVPTPLVPSSTTTSAPEYVMINPTRTSSENGDQDD